jgi:hypothetical protein
MTRSNPPAVPQALLLLLLPADARETVTGDLLEEYREARTPALGRLRANLWYWRQVGGIWFRAYWGFVVPVVLLLAVHDIFSTFRAPSGASYLDGLPTFVLAPMSPLVAVGFFGLAGAYGSWRTERWAGGFVAALGTSFVVWLFMMVWWNATLYPFAQVQQSNPYWIRHGTGARIARTRQRCLVSIPIRPTRPSSAGSFGTTLEGCSSSASRCWPCRLSAAASAAHSPCSWRAGVPRQCTSPEMLYCGQPFCGRPFKMRSAFL